MPAPDPQVTGLAGIALLLGEIRGQLRELVHQIANTNTKIDALGHRVAALEAERSERRGARDVLTMILKSPAIGWLIGAAGAAWALLSGKAHP